MPILALALGVLLHLGLLQLSRQVTITAVQQGLTVATAADGTTSNGTATARRLLDNHATVDILTLTATPSPTDVTMSATVRAPGVVPGLPRTITVTQAAALERWIAP